MPFDPRNTSCLVLLLMNNSCVFCITGVSFKDAAFGPDCLEDRFSSPWDESLTLMQNNNIVIIISNYLSSPWINEQSSKI